MLSDTLSYLLAAVIVTQAAFLVAANTNTTAATNVTVTSSHLPSTETGTFTFQHSNVTLNHTGTSATSFNTTVHDAHAPTINSASHDNATIHGNMTQHGNDTYHGNGTDHSNGTDHGNDTNHSNGMDHGDGTDHGNDTYHGNGTDHGNGTGHGNETHHGNEHHGNHHLTVWLSAVCMMIAILAFGLIFYYVYNKTHLNQHPDHRQMFLAKHPACSGVIGVELTQNHQNHVTKKPVVAKTFDVTVDVIQSKEGSDNLALDLSPEEDPDVPGTSSQGSPSPEPDHMPPDYHTVVTADPPPHENPI